MNESHTWNLFAAIPMPSPRISCFCQNMKSKHKRDTRFTWYPQRITLRLIHGEVETS
ncbi:unnamed protein product [Linum tenue]|uniref:Uncharacterized protein n=1 Tax=Linum tenue TaxID=586396 RepID=A0AAV0ISJ8_9ROSI|nr:unnamed protein product [Linum tenue]